MKFRARFRDNIATLFHNVLRVFKKHTTKQHDSLYFYVSKGDGLHGNQIIMCLKTGETVLKWTADVAEIFDARFSLSRECGDNSIWFAVKVDLLFKAIGICKKEVTNASIFLTSQANQPYLAVKVHEKSNTSSEQRVPIQKMLDAHIEKDILAEQPNKAWDVARGLHGQICLPEIKEFKAAVDHLVSLNDIINIEIDVNKSQGTMSLACDNLYLELKSTFQNLVFIPFDEDVDEESINGISRVTVKSKILQNFASVEMANPEAISCSFRELGLVMLAKVGHSSQLLFWIPLVDIPEEQFDEEM